MWVRRSIFRVIVVRYNVITQNRGYHVVRYSVNNPLVSVHDVGAGGLSNAMPELVHE